MSEETKYTAAVDAALACVDDPRGAPPDKSMPKLLNGADDRELQPYARSIARILACEVRRLRNELAIADHSTASFAREAATLREEFERAKGWRDEFHEKWQTAKEEHAHAVSEGVRIGEERNALARERAAIRFVLESARDKAHEHRGSADEKYQILLRAVDRLARANSSEIPNGSPGITDTQRLDWLQSHLIRTKWNEADEVFDAIYAAPRGELRPVIDAAITKGAVS